MNKYIDILLKLADEAELIGDIPVGAIVVKDGKIIGKGYNNRVDTKKTTGHAEINAILDACNSIGDWRLSDCDLYVTLEPCDMCIETIKEARIKNVYYLLSNVEKHKYKRTNVCNLKCDDFIVENYKEKLSNFFDKNLNR